MITPNDQIALTTLAFLANMGSQLDAFRAKLKQRVSLHTSSFVECRYYGDDVYLCICLEAALHENQTLTWWMDITPREGMWLIEASVLLNGRTPVVQAPPQRVYDFQAVQNEIPDILDQLLQAGAAVLDKMLVRQSSEKIDQNVSNSEVSP
ncbi:MAG TPA: hypothetical protein VMP08_06620 [Anaerolineae bacterium]|nr:hypothetical protein [Anaerolineae bacterium]